VRRSTVWIGCLLLVLASATEVCHAQQRANPPKPLPAAAMDGDIEQLKGHIARGADLNKGDMRGIPPLCHAAEWGKTEAVKLLLDAGAQINITDNNGKTPLLGATMRGHVDVIAILVSRGADVKAKDNFGMTALHTAAQWGHRDIVSALVNAGADVNAEDRRQRTPLMLARQARKTEIVDFLKQHGATEPAAFDSRSPYGDYMYDSQAAPTAQASRPGAPAPVQQANIVIDPNAIREEMSAFAGLAAAVQAVDANSSTEQRAWVQRRYDNRTTLLRAVQRQFEQEMTFVAKVATEEKKAETVKAVADLTAKRKKRYDVIGDELRQQRREALLAARETPAATRGMATGRSRGRSSRGRSTATTTTPYGSYTPSTPATTRRPEADEPALDPQTESQMQAWLNTTADKNTLLDAVHSLDLSEFDALRQVAVEHEANKTSAAISGLMMLRQQRLQNIAQKWQQDDERQQRIQERTQQAGVPGMPQDQQTGTRRGRRYR
jgi:hypothetical protein